MKVSNFPKKEHLGYFLKTMIFSLNLLILEVQKSEIWTLFDESLAGECTIATQSKTACTKIE